MNGLLEFLKGLATKPGSFLEGIEMNNGLMIGGLGLLLIWLASAFASYEFANSTGKNGKVHFWIGLILPVVYPFILFIRMLAVKSAAVSAARKTTEKMALERDEIEAEKRRIDSTPNQDNFAKLKATSDGSSVKAQFRLDLADDTNLMIAKILEAQEGLAAFELASEGGEAPRVLRMPYAKMSKIERL